MADEDEDLDAEFAQFEAQIQTVVSKPKPPAPVPSLPKPSPTTPSPRPPQSAPTPPRPALAPTSTAPPTNPSPAPVAAGKWKWDGAKWNWVVTTHAATPPSSRLPVSLSSSPQVLPVSSAPLPAGPSLPAQPAASVKRTAAGEVWRDATLVEWPSNDHRIFVGDLAPDATDAELEAAFSRYASFNMAKVVQDKRTGHCKGYGFVSFAAGEDMIAALREMNGKYVGSRPVKLKKSNWQKRNLDQSRRKELKLFKQIVKKRNR